MAGNTGTTPGLVTVVGNAGRGSEPVHQQKLFQALLQLPAKKYRKEGEKKGRTGLGGREKRERWGEIGWTL